MKKSVIEIEIVELPGNDGYEARIPKLGGATYRGCGDSEKEALESLGLILADIEAKKKCKYCKHWTRQDKVWGICETLQADPLTYDDYDEAKVITKESFWCCDFEKKDKKHERSEK